MLGIRGIKCKQFVFCRLRETVARKLIKLDIDKREPFYGYIESCELVRVNCAFFSDGCAVFNDDCRKHIEPVLLVRDWLMD